MHIIKCTLPRELSSVLLVPIADTHLGDPRANVAILNERIQFVAQRENAYAILNGDILNNAVRNGVSDVYGERLSPMEAVKMAADMFAPIKNKIIGVTDGNHEDRTYRNDGLHLGQFIAAELGIADKYANDALFIFLRFGTVSNGKQETNGSGEKRRVCYTIYCTHGDGGGRKEGAKAIRLADMAAVADADIYIHSHTHLPMVMKQGFYRVDVRNSTIARVEKTFVNTGAYLDYGGYAEKKGYKPPSMATPVIMLSGIAKNVTASM